MSPLVCPKCGQLVSDQALDAGECPHCGYDGALIAAANPKRAWLLSTLAVVICGGALGAYLLVPRAEPGRLRERETTVAKAAPSLPSPSLPAEPEIAPLPRAIISRPQPAPIIAAPPKKHRPNPGLAVVGPVERIDARSVREKRIDAPEGGVSISDMNRDQRLILRGTVRQLRLGSVGGRATLDASGLAAEEIIISGDIHGNATVKLRAPDGMVTISGHVEGSARVTIDAPRGEVVVSAGSGKLDGEGRLTVVARSVEIRGVMAGNAKMFVTLTGGGSVISGPARENAAVILVPPGEE